MASIVFAAPVSFSWVASYAGLSQAHAMTMYAWRDLPILHLAIWLQSIGILLFAVSILRVAIYPRWIAILLIIASVLLVIGEYVPMPMIGYLTAGA